MAANGTRREQERRNKPRPLWAFSNDDRGNGQRFIETHGTDVAWVPDTKSTHVWLGARWEADTGARMRNLAHLLTDQMLSGAKLRFALYQAEYDLVEHLDPKDPDRIKAKEKRDTAEQFLKWSKSSRMDSRLKACVTSAVANPGTSVKSGRWDAHTQLLNIGNGTLELHLDGSHTFREHQQADRLTQQAGVEYDPNAECPTFTRYLNRTLPKPDVRRVVRALAGLSLLGDNNHHIFPVLIGKGRCGKTTLLEVLAGVLDNAAEPAIAYSGSFSLTILRPKQGGGAGPNASLFRIMSRRFVYCSESNDGVALNAELVKRFCGGDRQEARDTYDRARGISDRVPAFTPWLGTNKAPEIEGADDALRERIPVIPFDQYLEPNERDPYLVQKILAEKSGVLNWMLDGTATSWKTRTSSATSPKNASKPPRTCTDP
ncbi:MAG: phage/plasmid primase, P4 family [Actinobacteria bacterium]|nr:phage/plasmid primase, P4 family [Actinomycetota bacterium]